MEQREFLTTENREKIEVSLMDIWEVTPILGSLCFALSENTDQDKDILWKKITEINKLIFQIKKESKNIRNIMLEQFNNKSV